MRTLINLEIKKLRTTQEIKLSKNEKQNEIAIFETYRIKISNNEKDEVEKLKKQFKNHLYRQRVY